MKNLNELSGIIKGINFDGIINEKEVNYLRYWKDQNKDFALTKDEKGLIQVIETSLKDGFITEDERTIIQETLNKLMNSTKKSQKLYIELIGIIEGIISDDVINTLEVQQLRNWYEKYGMSLSVEDALSIKQVLDHILEDGIVTSKEKTYLLDYLRDKIHMLKINSKIDNLRRKIKKRENIGIDLILLLDDNLNVESIHKKAEDQLRRGLTSYTGFSVRDPEIVVLSLSLIAILGYDSNFYKTVRETYNHIYSNFSQQKIDGLIRSVLSRYQTERDENDHGRIINVALEQSIVPIYFLSNFFEFIFDIYERNFQYHLPDNLDSEFMFIYEGLFSNMKESGDSFVVNATRKTYKLIQSTKDLIIKKHNYEPLIQLSKIIIHIIDDFFWDKTIDLSNKYLSEGFGKWTEGIRNKNELKKDHSIIRSSWKPEFYIKNQKIMLSIPQHKIRASKGYLGLKVIVKNDDKILYENNSLDVREIIGGYQVIVPHVEIPIPLGKLNYCVYVKNEVIYDSNDDLYRDIIVFNQNSGFEIKNNSDYSGNAILCTIDRVAHAKEYYLNEFYRLSILKVQLGDSIIVHGNFFNFSKMTKPEILGEKYNEANVENVITKKKIPIFKKIKYILFEDDINVANSEDYKLFLNNKEYKLSEFDYSVNSHGGVSRFIIKIDLLESGIYSLIVKKDKNILLYKEFMYDPIFSYQIDKLTNMQYVVNLKSSLVQNDLHFDLDFNQYDKQSLIFEYNKQQYYWNFIYDFNIYSLINSSYLDFNEDLWIYDIKSDSRIKVLLHDIDKVSIYSSKGNLIDEDISFVNKDHYLYLPIGFLMSYKNSYDFVSIFFMREGELIGMIRCNNRCNISKNGVSINFDHINLEMDIITQFEGKGKIYYEIYDDRDLFVKKSSFAENDEIVKINFEKINSFKKYKIKIYEKPNTLLFIRKQEPLKIVEKVLYDQKDFAGKIFKIKKGYYSKFYNNELIELSSTLIANYVFIKEQLSDNKFQGQLFTKTDTGVYWLNNVNPVEIEIISDDIRGNIEILITNEGDGLLIDSVHKKIMNRLEEFNAPCIDSYIMSLQPEEEL